MVIRVATLPVGVALNLAFLRIASQALDVGQFGTISIALSISGAIQYLDGGIQSYFVSSTAASFTTTNGWRLRPWYLALSGVSIASGTVVAAVVVPIYGWSNGSTSEVAIPIVLGALSGVVANVLGLPLADLLRRERVNSYYACYAIQPVALVIFAACLRSGPHPLIFLCLAIVFSNLSPGLAAIALMRGDDAGTHELLPKPTSADRPTVKAIVIASGSIGVRQATALLSFGFTPIFAGFVGGGLAAGQSTLAFRIFSSCWSVIGVVYHTYWARMARAVADRDRSAVRAVSRAVRLRGFVVGAGLGTAGFLFAIAFGSRIVGDAQPGAIVYLLALAALIVRALFLGSSLACATIGPGYRLALTEAIATVASTAAVLLTHGPSPVTRAVLTLLTASVLTGVIGWWRVRDGVGSRCIRDGKAWRDVSTRA